MGMMVELKDGSDDEIVMTEPFEVVVVLSVQVLVPVYVTPDTVQVVYP